MPSRWGAFASLMAELSRWSPRALGNLFCPQRKSRTLSGHGCSIRRAARRPCLPQPTGDHIVTEGTL